jgi:Ni/Fe-hydrogenase subunit HybB-like protein
VTDWLRGVQAGLGRRLSWAALGAVAIGVVAFMSGLLGGDSPRTFGALIASWLFFAGAAAGALAFRAFFQIVDARWARPLAAIGAVPIGFLPVAMVVLVVILIGAGLAPWLPPGAEGWPRVLFLAGRQLVLSAVLFGFAYRKLRAGPAHGGRPSVAGGVVYCLLFAVVLSFWGFDFVLGPDPSFQSTLIGPYVFMSAFVAGTGLVTLIGLLQKKLSDAERRDVGAFTLALSIFWGYLFWSQYLTIWYGNLPDEVTFALRRSSGAVLTVVTLVFALPFVALLHHRGRGSSRVLGGLVAVQLVGLWLNCHLLVVPSLAATGAPALGTRDVLIALGMLGAFALSSARTPPAVATRDGQGGSTRSTADAAVASSLDTRA